MPEIKRPPRPDGNSAEGFNSNDAIPNITESAENSKPFEALTWRDYKALLISHCVNGGTGRETAARFAQGEISAILAGNHWTHGKPTPPDPQAAIIACLLEYELSADEKEQFTERAGILEFDAHMDRATAESRAMAEVLHRRHGAVERRETCTADPEIPPEPEPRKYEGSAALTEYTKRGIKLMACVHVENDQKKFRPIVGNDKWDSKATADIELIKKYMSGVLWPNVPIRLFRFIPYEADLSCLDIDKGHGNGVDGEAEFYRLIRAHGYDPLPPLLRDLQAFPVRVETPSGGLHLYFSYNGPPIKKAVLAESIEVFNVDPLTAAGSEKENKPYILYGNLDEAPPVPAELLEIITNNKKQRQALDFSRLRGNSSSRNGDDKELLKSRLLEYIKKKGIKTTKKGGKEWINCPLHDDSEPSMQINTSGRYAGILKCYACGASLNVFGLARIMAGLPDGKKHFPQVAQEIKNTLGTG
jgi:hypothetical protein